MTMDETFEIVDEQGAVTGTALRSACHGNPALLHQAVHVLAFTTAGELLLQLRHPDKDVEPNKWDSSVGGHVQPGESPEAAARRETEEEVGLVGVDLRYLYRYIWRCPLESELITTFRLVHDGPYRPQPDELADVRVWTVQQINETLGSGMFTPNFENEWQLYLEYQGA